MNVPEAGALPKILKIGGSQFGNPLPSQQSNPTAPFAAMLNLSSCAMSPSSGPATLAWPVASLADSRHPPRRESNGHEPARAHAWPELVVVALRVTKARIPFLPLTLAY